MNMIKRWIHLVLYLLLILYLPAYSGQTTGAAEGHVIDGQTEEPISKAKVILVFAKSQTARFELYSDKKGHFYKGGLTPGMYDVTVEKEGYLPMQSSLRIRLGDTPRVEIRLETYEGLSSQSTRLLDQGINLLSEDKYEEAIEKLTEAVLEEPSNPVSYYYRGASYEKNGDRDKALEDYQKSIELKADFVLPISRTARIYAWQDDFEKAIEYYKRATDLGDQDTTTYFNYAGCLTNNGNREEARIVFEKLLTLDENYSDAYYQLGLIYIGLGDAETAKELLRKFIDMDPENQNAALAKEILKSLN